MLSFYQSCGKSLSTSENSFLGNNPEPPPGPIEPPIEPPPTPIDYDLFPDEANIYVDKTLASDCTAGKYSIASRDCNGTDGIAYLKSGKNK